MRTQSCVGHALRMAVTTSLNQQGTPLDFDVSPVGIYDLARCIDRIPYEDGSLPPLNDLGCEPNEAMRGLQEWGLCPYSVRPTIEYQINDEPSFLQLEMGSTSHIYGAYKATGTPDQVRQQVMETIGVKHTPVCIAMPVDSAIVDWQPAKGPHGSADWNHILGWHYVCVVGYDTSTTGEVVWEYANSWTNWGFDQGFGRGGQAWADQWRDVMVCQVRRTP